MEGWSGDEGRKVGKQEDRERKGSKILNTPNSETNFV